MRRAIDQQIDALRTDLLRWVDAQLAPLHHYPEASLSPSDTAVAMEVRAKECFGLRSLRSAQFLMMLAHAPDRCHPYAAFVQPGEPVTPGGINSIRVCLSDLRKRMNALGFARVVRNRYQLGYYMTTGDAALILSHLAAADRRGG